MSEAAEKDERRSVTRGGPPLNENRPERDIILRERQKIEGLKGGNSEGEEEARAPLSNA